MTRGLDIDDPATTALRRRIIQEKLFLRDIYVDWYRALASALPSGEGMVLELGSGAGFCRNHVPDLMTSEVFYCRFVDVILDGQLLPFRAKSLRGVVMTNVLHHVQRPDRFLLDAARCVRPGGVIAMIEPWASRWSRAVYERLHHEPFEVDADLAGTCAGGPLTGANGAIPWILFSRDRALFERSWPQWRIETIEPTMPFRYLVSGGVSMRTFMPGWTTPVWRWLEHRLDSRMDHWAMFARIVLRRTTNEGTNAH